MEAAVVLPATEQARLILAQKKSRPNSGRLFDKFCERTINAWRTGSAYEHQVDPLSYVPSSVDHA